MALNPVKIYASQGKVVFESDGRTVDPKFLGTLVASSVETNRVKIDRTDKTNVDGEPQNLFRRMINSRVLNEDGESLVDDLGYTQAEVIDYLNRTFNQPASAGALIMGISQAIEFTLDETRTTILTSLGQSYAVNSIKAYEQANGLIGIALFSAAGTITDDIYSDIYPDNVTISGQVCPSHVGDCINALNALFFQTGAPTILTQDSTVVLDGGTQVTYDIGSDIVASGGVFTTSVTPQTDQHWVATNETIDAIGEFFTVVMSDNTASPNTGSLDTWGLIDTASTLWTDRDTTGLPFDGDYAAHTYAGYNGPWTNNYPNVALQPLTVWTTSPEYTDYFAGTGVLFRCGINTDGYGIWGFWSASDSEWKDLYRTPQPLTVGPEYAMYFTPRYGDANVVMHDTQASTQVFEQDPTNPPSTYYYIENADGTYDYPLFATSTEAEQYDVSQGGAGATVQEAFLNDAQLGRIWYAPATGYQDDTVTPPSGLVATWNEIPTTPAVTVPEPYAANSLTVDELAAVNFNVHPTGLTSYTTTLSNLPTGMSQSGDFLVGSAPEVTGDYVANPSDSYAITVTRTNSAGSSQGTLTLNVTNLTAPVTAVTGATHVAGTTSLIDPDTMDDGSVVHKNNTLDDGERFIIDTSYVETYILPALVAGGAGTQVWVGIDSATADFVTSIDAADFEAYILFEYTSATSHTVTLAGDTTNALTINSMTSAIYDYAFEADDTLNNIWVIGCNIGSIMNEPSPSAGGTFTRAVEKTSVPATPHDIAMGVVGGTLDFDPTALTYITTPAAPTSSTAWTKAVTFTGGSEHMRQGNSSYLYSPLALGNTSSTVAAPTPGSGLTTPSGGHPWATAVVFKIAGHGSNQHIWNYGEGAGSVDDNIYLRVDAGGGLYFGWGRDGALNEHLIVPNLGSNSWYGAYVAHTGARFSGSDATASNLAANFQIKLMFYTGGSWDFNPNPTAFGAGTWTTTGGRMDRQITGPMTIGGRGSNRNFHGEIASMVVTTLRNNDSLPSDAEIQMMVTDPVKWMSDYKAGSTYRRPPVTSDHTSVWAVNSIDSSYGTQVWLMGETPDTYPTLYNVVHPSGSQNTRMAMQNMVSSDIINVTIPGLS